MRLVAFTFVDHQDVVGYEIGYAASRLLWTDRIFIGTSNDENAALVIADVARYPALTLSGRVEIRPLGTRISTPGDIPVALNATADWVKSVDPCDFLLMTPADTLATIESKNYSKDFCIEENRDLVTHFPVQESKLYHDFGGGWGQTLFGRDWPGRFDPKTDGIPQGGRKLYSEWPWWTERVCLHAGYLSVDMVHRHFLQHEKTWGVSEYARGRALYESGGREAFADWAFEHFVQVHGRPTKTVEEADPRFTKVIDDLGLRQECTWMTKRS